jgi:hypothetical protein
MKLKQLAPLFAQKRSRLFIAFFYASGEQFRLLESAGIKLPTLR